MAGNSNASLSSGVSMTVSTQDMESKIDAATGKFIKSLSKSQKALGMSIDEMGRYVNANGKVVEGLNQSQIKLGQYVDELGRLRTENGGFVADLSKLEQALGFYADSYGKVFNAQNEYVRSTKDVEKAAADEARAIKELSDSSQRTKDAIGAAMGSFAGVAGQVSQLLATLAISDERVDSFRNHFIQLTQGFSVGLKVFQASYQALNNFGKYLLTTKSALTATTVATGPAAAGLSAVGTSAQTASVGMRALQMAAGPVGIAIAAIGAGLAAIATTSHLGKTENSELADSFDELDKRAKAAGDSIKSVADALKYGAFASQASEYDRTASALLEASDAYQKASAAYEAAEAKRKAQAEAVRYGGMGAGGVNVGMDADTLKEFKAAEKAQKEAWAEYNKVVTTMIDAARSSQKTEVERLEEQIKAYRDVQTYAKDVDDQQIVQKQILSLEQKISAIKAKEAQDAADAQKKSADAARERQLAALGIVDYLGKEKESTRQSADTLDEMSDLLNNQWLPAYKDGILSTKEYTEAIKQLRNDAVDYFKNQFDVDITPLPAIDANSVEGVQTAYDELQKALEDSVITQEQFNAGASRLGDRLTNLLKSSFDGSKDFAEVAGQLSAAMQNGMISFQQYESAMKDLGDKARKSLESDLGVSFKQETSFSDKVKQLDTAYENGVISMSEYEDAYRQLTETARGAIPGVESLLSSAEAAFKANVQRIQDGYKNGLITAKERDELIYSAQETLAKAYDDKAAALGEDKVDFEKLQKAYEDALKEERKNSKADPSKSMSSGSEELYLAQVKNSTANYQSRVASTTENLFKTSRESLFQSQQTNYYLQTLVDGNASVGVFG